MSSIPDTAEFPPPSSVRPPSAHIRVEIAARSHPGNVRENNEDHYFVARIDRHLDAVLTNVPQDALPGLMSEVGYGYLVADGMGGAAAGEVASRSAISTFINLVLETPAWIMNFQGEWGDEVVRRMTERFRQVDAELSERARTTPGLSGMGTTLTLACSVAADLLVIHVGDSRAYLYRDGGLHRLTHDQTIAQALADAGSIPEDEVAHSRYRHVLTQAIGRKGGEVKAEVGRVRLQDGDRLLMCSDGLTEMVDDVAIAALLGASDSTGHACEALLERALENGGRDNVTVVVARYHLPAEG